jgi:hypothetical protein
MSRLLTVLIALALLSACTATIEPPKAKIVIPAGNVHTGPAFCPPGQAKKGNC